MSTKATDRRAKIEAAAPKGGGGALHWLQVLPPQALMRPSLRRATECS